ncbi:MAG TPA: glycosyltransferase family 4 protein [Gemmatimonadales bacterium]|nr:glycosyltransferase family 4 protein [Gemmatimonadales bacterium]
MRVLLLNYEYPPFGGGAGVATEALARGLARRGMMVEVITAGEQAGEQSELLWDGAAANEGLLTVHRVPVKRIGVHQAGMRAALDYLRAALPLVRRRLREQQYDIVHFFFSLPTAAMLPLLDLGETPVVVSLRGSDVPGYDPHQRGLERAHRALLPLTRWIWRRATRVVAVCESLGRLAQETLPGLEYSVIQNGVDLERFRPRANGRAAPSQRIRCLAVSRLVERKGLDDLLRAFASLERGRYELEIVGGGADERPLRALTTELGLDDLVRFTGPLDRVRTAARYRDADIFTLASWEEAFGNAFAEALASGLPVIGSNVGGIPELVEHGRHGVLVPPRDPATLAAAIRFLAERPELRAEMGRRNRAHAEANLSWERMTTRYLATYQGLRRRAPARAMLAQASSSSW